MTTPNATPNDTFWLARYAYNTLTPAIQALPGQTEKVYVDLKLAMSFTGRFPGLDVWIHWRDNGTTGVLDYRLSVAKGTIDFMAESLANVWAAWEAVTA